MPFPVPLWGGRRSRGAGGEERGRSARGGLDGPFSWVLKRRTGLGGSAGRVGRRKARAALEHILSGQPAPPGRRVSRGPEDKRAAWGADGRVGYGSPLPQQEVHGPSAA